MNKHKLPEAMLTFQIEILGPPKGKHTHRRGTHSQYADPRNKINGQRIIDGVLEFLEDFEYKALFPFTGTVGLHVASFFPSTDVKKGELIPYTGKPDGTNILKLAEDVLNNILWEDDKNIWEVGCSKWSHSSWEKMILNVTLYRS